MSGLPPPGTGQVATIRSVAGSSTVMLPGPWRPPAVVFQPRLLMYMRRRSEEHTSELQSLAYLVCRLLLEKKKKKKRHDVHVPDPCTPTDSSSTRPAHCPHRPSTWSHPT